MQSVLSRDGTVIGVEVTGSGDPLVLVHGTSADHTRWAPIAPALAEHFTLYAVDRRGRGGSGDNQPYAIEREYDDIAAVVDSIAWNTGKRVNLLGHSWGALCSLGAALLTANLENLILYEPPPPGETGFIDPVIFDRLRELLEAGDRAGVVSTFLHEVAGVSSADLALLREAPSWNGRIRAAHTILRENVAAMPEFDAQQFAGVKTRTLLLLGGDSNRFFVESINKVHSALANSTVVVLPGQRHVAMNSAPELFAATVLDFLKPNAQMEG